VGLSAYRDWTQLAPWPSDEQCARFAWQVMRAHSWYKGSLHRGTRIIVYLDPELGGTTPSANRLAEPTTLLTSAPRSGARIARLAWHGFGSEPDQHVIGVSQLGGF
jgi:hypothetical protein